MGQMTLAPHCVLCSAGVRHSPAEKREIIDLVEHSALPVGRTLAELDVPRRSFSRQDTGTVYRWYQQYQQEGEKGLEPQPSKRRQFWNRLPEPVCHQIVRPLPGPSAGAGPA